MSDLPERPFLPGGGDTCRRAFLRFFAASPLCIAAPYLIARAAADVLDDERLLTSPADALNVLDFEPAMRAKTPPAHYGYMASGVDGEETLRANREAFQHFYLRPRRLVDISKASMRCNLFGTEFDNPIILAPTGGNMAYDPGGEETVARACRPGNHAMVLSTAANMPIERVTEARGAPVWFQLYPTSNWAFGRQMIKRAQAARATVIMLTVDRAGGARNQETLIRLRRLDTRDCASCHGDHSLKTQSRRIAMLQEFDMTGVTMVPADATWDLVKRVRDATSVKLVIKGLLTAEDAQLALQHGADGIVVSNHGARSEDGGPGTLDLLPGIVSAVGDRVPIIIDGGFRRGADIMKALCLGATAVQIGRPYLWGLGAFGQPGVERVLELLRAELMTLFKQMGAASPSALNSTMVGQYSGAGSTS